MDRSVLAMLGAGLPARALRDCSAWGRRAWRPPAPGWQRYGRRVGAVCCRGVQRVVTPSGIAIRCGAPLDSISTRTQRQPTRRRTVL